MRDGATYIIAAYSLAALVLFIWFAMILRRLRITRHLAAQEGGDDA